MIDVMAKNALIGWTGFVGLELLKHLSDCDLYNSSNISSLASKSYGCIYFAGLPAEKWKINQAPEADQANLRNILRVLDTVSADRFVLISTVDVLDATVPQAEDGTVWATHPYGVHRRQMEEYVARRYADHLILRLPGLFGRGLKKNVLYDLLHDNQVDQISLGSTFQWYGIGSLYDDIQRCAGLRCVHLVSPPIETSVIVRRFFPGAACKGARVVSYQLRHGDGYWTSEEAVLAEMDAWISAEQRPQLSRAVSNIAWDVGEMSDALKLCKRYGITQVELAPTKFGEWFALGGLEDAIVKRAREFPCTYVSCQSILYNTGIHIFEEPERFVTHYRVVASLCMKLGIRTVVFGSPTQRRPGGRGEGDIIPYFKQIADISREHGLLFCIEPNAKGYGCTWLTTIGEVLAFLQKVGDDCLRINVDTGNYCMEGDRFEFTSESVAYIGSLQVSNRGLLPLCEMTAEDRVTSRQLVRQICVLGWKGTISLEQRPSEPSLLLRSLEVLEEILAV
jgi:sugar phosphate isomerase/epimerase